MVTFEDYYFFVLLSFPVLNCVLSNFTLHFIVAWKKGGRLRDKYMNNLSTYYTPIHFPLPIESKHAACDGHVHWHLCRHATNQQHLLTRIRMEGRVIDVFGPPQLILRQAWCHNSLSVQEDTAVSYFNTSTVTSGTNCFIQCRCSINFQHHVIFHNRNYTLEHLILQTCITLYEYGVYFLC